MDPVQKLAMTTIEVTQGFLKGHGFKVGMVVYDGKRDEYMIRAAPPYSIYISATPSEWPLVRVQYNMVGHPILGDNIEYGEGYEERVLAFIKEAQDYVDEHTAPEDY
jgi:hypothetical protein